MAVLHVIILLFTNFIFEIQASFHWVVTENGKIQTQIRNSAFPLRRPDDLVLLLEQEQRINAITRIYKEFKSFKRSIDNQWAKIEGEGDFEKRLYATDKDCILGVEPLTQHDLTTDFVGYGEAARPKMKPDFPQTEPDCTRYSKLDFSMMTFPHLETLNRRDNLTINSAISKTSFRFDVDAMLKKNHTDWTAYNAASLYWRLIGNGTNALECARRAIYFSPRDKRHIALLNLGTLLQELQSLGEAAIVLHSAVDHDPLQHISHLALGNVYALLGDYTRSLACYENVLSLDPENERVLQLKHALRCQEKLESGLLQIHSLLQNILHDLQRYHEMMEYWQLLQNQLNWERDSKVKDFYSYSRPNYVNLRLLILNVEKQAKSLMSDVSKSVWQKKNLGQPEQSESKLDCVTGSCTVRRIDGGGSSRSARVDEESELEMLDSSEYVLRTKMNSLIDFMKSLSYDAEVNPIEFKRKIRQQINFLRSLNEDSHFSEDQTTFLNNFDSCLDSHHEFKTLNACFMKVLDMYSLNVSNRIVKLKEKMELMSQEESRKNFLADESTLENYIEVAPELMFESESCQRFRDKTEL
ncbi:UNVERIFIED_CONTAM: hypothetical protein PYX00_010464 [Menopon gallinae]|uniref:Tetratricopeptide repeat protein 17 n=1 Tax=Menopon gallinae TaxID=328185 RepID=A0AAW2HFN6_9NEOP